MKYLFHLAVLSMLAVGQNAADADEAKPAAKQNLAADFGVCPDGHKSLKDVPIVWGHFELFTKRPKEYTEPERELAAREKRGEIVFGGDVIPQNSPKFRVVCDRCGFSFHPGDFTPEELQMLDLPPDWDAFWSRNSKDAGGFRIPFTKQLLSFPQMNAPSGTISYSQTFTGDGRQLKHESILFHSPLPVDQVLEAARKWLKAEGRDPDDLKRVEDAFAHHTYHYDEDEIGLFLRDDSHFEEGKILVSLMLGTKVANNAQK